MTIGSLYLIHMRRRTFVPKNGFKIQLSLGNELVRISLIDCRESGLNESPLWRFLCVTLWPLWLAFDCFSIQGKKSLTIKNTELHRGTPQRNAETLTSPQTLTVRHISNCELSHYERVQFP